MLRYQVCKLLVVYQLYCMALYHSQAQCNPKRDKEGRDRSVFKYLK